MLTGNSGNNTLNGGAGNDTMVGGTGNDTYVVDSAGDTVNEAAGAGTDRVNAYVSDTLDANVENLYLYGSAISGTGNTLNNIIYGNSNANTLNGGAGNDTMVGGTGNDTYYVDSASDIVSEAASAGTDTVVAYVNYTLGANLEILDMYEDSHTGTGNTLNNIIYGNDSTTVGDYLYGLAGNDKLYGYDGNDILNGGTGNDTLYGGAGQDHFVFAESGSSNQDMINYFSHTDDTIVLKDILDGVTDSAIKGLFFNSGVLNEYWYFEGAGLTGNDNSSQLSGIYNNTTTGEIWYNPTDNNVNSGDSVLICTVGSATAASLDQTDFVYSA
jgi:Ca2+-binding RTX toxin-like protein